MTNFIQTHIAAVRDALNEAHTCGIINNFSTLYKEKMKTAVAHLSSIEKAVTAKGMRSAEEWEQHGHDFDGVWGFDTIANKNDRLSFIEAIQADAIAAHAGGKG